jgi:hypothetical protein
MRFSSYWVNCIQLVQPHFVERPRPPQTAAAAGRLNDGTPAAGDSGVALHLGGAADAAA